MCGESVGRGVGVSVREGKGQHRARAHASALFGTATPQPPPAAARRLRRNKCTHNTSINRHHTVATPPPTPSLCPPHQPPAPTYEDHVIEYHQRQHTLHRRRQRLFTPDRDVRPVPRVRGLQGILRRGCHPPRHGHDRCGPRCGSPCSPSTNPFSLVYEIGKKAQFPRHRPPPRTQRQHGVQAKQFKEPAARAGPRQAES